MLENERRQKGSIRVWMDSIQADFHGVVETIKTEIKNNRVIAQGELNRPVQILGTDEEASFVLWTIQGRLLKHLRSRHVASEIDPEELAILLGQLPPRNVARPTDEGGEDEVELFIS